MKNAFYSILHRKEHINIFDHRLNVFDSIDENKYFSGFFFFDFLQILKFRLRRENLRKLVR